MELYNFFSEIVKGRDRIDTLRLIYEELQPICKRVGLFADGDGKECKCFIAGQMLSDDTNHGSTDLMAIFNGEIKYTWFDAHCPSINNIEIDGHSTPI